MEIEEQLYCARRGELLAWDIPDLEAGAESAGFINITTEAEEIREQRYIRKADIQRWLANSTSPDTLGSYLQQNYSAETAEHLIAALQHELGELTVDWRSTVCFLQAQRSST